MRIIEFSGLGGWTGEAAAAMQASPNYFAFFYQAKSFALVAAVAALAYYIGKNSRA